MGPLEREMSASGLRKWTKQEEMKKSRNNALMGDAMTMLWLPAADDPDITVRGVTVILAQRRISNQCAVHEILRCAQDDRHFTGV